MEEINEFVLPTEWSEFANNVINIFEVFDGAQYIFKFDNDYGASVIRHKHTYGGDKGLWELAVIRHLKDEYDEDIFYIVYDTPITDDTIGYLTNEEVREYLNRIKNL